MNLTLLLDLDNTLLDSNMDSFIPVYFQALSSFLEDLVEPELMLSALMAGTRKMMENDDPRLTLQQVFDREFFPKLGCTREKLQSRIDEFYGGIFPTLSYLTKPRPEAITLVNWALDQSIHLAVATNPLFPRVAIHHRLRWAGLPPEDVPFSVVSAYEDFHFSKPNPAYFAEVLGRMGWPEGPVLMVGDDPERDLVGSHILGLPTYWINTSDDKTPEGVEPIGRGAVADLHAWLKTTDLSILEPAFSSTSSLCALMLSTPAAISGLLADLINPKRKGAEKRKPAKMAGLTRRPIPDEWSLTEILCHMRDTEIEVNHPRLRMLLELDDPFIPARMVDTWAEERGYNSQDATQMLRDFTAARLVTVRLLRSLTVEWERKARHAIFGPTNLKELVKFMVEHDKLHVRQIYSTLKLLTS